MRLWSFSKGKNYKGGARGIVHRETNKKARINILIVNVDILKDKSFSYCAFRLVFFIYLFIFHSGEGDRGGLIISTKSSYGSRLAGLGNPFDCLFAATSITVNVLSNKSGFCDDIQENYLYHSGHFLRMVCPYFFFFFFFHCYYHYCHYYYSIQLLAVSLTIVFIEYKWMNI